MKNNTDDSKLSGLWSKDIVDAGWLGIPHLLLEYYHKLEPYGLTHGEAMFTIHVLQHRWRKEKDPYPSLKTIAERMGISHRSARRLSDSIKAKKLLKTTLRRGFPSEYDFSPLIQALEPFAKKRKEQKDASSK